MHWAPLTHPIYSVISTMASASAKTMSEDAHVTSVPTDFGTLRPAMDVLSVSAIYSARST
jgi:hypothetical protein